MCLKHIASRRGVKKKKEAVSFRNLGDEAEKKKKVRS